MHFQRKRKFLDLSLNWNHCFFLTTPETFIKCFILYIEVVIVELLLFVESFQQREAWGTKINHYLHYNLNYILCIPLNMSHPIWEMDRLFLQQHDYRVFLLALCFLLLNFPFPPPSNSFVHPFTVTGCARRPVSYC